MRISRIGRWALLALSLFVLLFGCGGGASNVAGSGLNVFFSDDFNDDYDQVWVKVHQIDVVGERGVTTVFQSADGEVMDLAALNDGAPRFAFMGSGVVSGPQLVRVTLDSQLSLVPTGGSDAVRAEFDPLLNGAGNRTVIELVISDTQTADSVVVDFDLSQWSLVNGYVNPVIRVGSQDGLDRDERHEERSMPGVISGLIGELPDQSFVLSNTLGQSVSVTTNSETVVYGPDGGAATLANGQSVMVSGSYSPATGGVLAGEIKIGDGQHHRHRILGEAFDANFESSTFLVELIKVRGFIPDHRIVTVLTPEGTRYLSPSGETITKARFYEAISTNDKKIVAEGLYDSASNIFTAAVVKLHHRHDGHHEVETVGEVVHVDRGHHSFALDWREWVGGPEPEGDVIRVVTGDRTEFFSPDGTPIRADAFFREIQPGAIVDVKGDFDESVLRAFRVRVRSWGGGNDHHVAFGEVREIDAPHWRFALALIEWHGFETDRHVIDVFVPESAEIFDAERNSFTREHFFHELEPGAKVTVYGLFSEGTMTARKIVVHRWGGDGHHARAIGTATEWNQAEGRFWLSLIEWSGFESGVGHELKVQSHERTVFKNQSGVTISKEQFFHDLTLHTVVLVEGRHNGEYMDAGFCKLLE